MSKESPAKGCRHGWKVERSVIFTHLIPLCAQHYTPIQLEMDIVFNGCMSYKTLMAVDAGFPAVLFVGLVMTFTSQL